MATSNRLNTLVGWVLGAAAVAFVLLLAGVASDALTDDPPADSPYATRSSDDGGSEDSVESGPAAITIEAFDFGAPISVAVGRSVAVTNLDGVAHTWTSTEGVFDSGSLSGDGLFTFTFDQPGEYPFFCSFHPSMTGTITVTE